MKKLIARYLEIDSNLLCEDKELSLTNLFTQEVEYKGICFAYSSYQKFTFYRILNPIQYNAIQRIIAIKESANKKGTKTYNKYHWQGKSYKKGNSERLKKWYYRVHSIAFQGEYKEINI